jgi:hypothetical protein
VADGTRTRDFRDHNPGLYQLSYGHRARTSVARLRRRLGSRGQPAGTLTFARACSSVDRAADF